MLTLIKKKQCHLYTFVCSKQPYVKIRLLASKLMYTNMSVDKSECV